MFEAYDVYVGTLSKSRVYQYFQIRFKQATILGTPPTEGGLCQSSPRKKESTDGVVCHPFHLSLQCVPPAQRNQYKIFLCQLQDFC